MQWTHTIPTTIIASLIISLHNRGSNFNLMAVMIDLNSDLGEAPDRYLDEQIMPYISSCNIACGGHAGNASTIEQTIDLANRHNVAIGAHPSFPDRENFGRKTITIDDQKLKDSLIKQILSVQNIAQRKGTCIHHIKPHGALYNCAAKDEHTAELICTVVKEIDPALKLYGLACSVTEQIAQGSGISFTGEAFADRQYEDSGALRSRTLSGAILTNEKQVLRQVEELVFRHRVLATDWITIQAQTICLHSDTRNAVTLAKKIHEYLISKGTIIATV